MSETKFLRNFQLTAASNVVGAAPIVIGLPFTIEIDVTRNWSNALNSANIRIYNLSAQHRNALLKDWYDSDVTRTISLQAGYGMVSNLPTIYYGTIFQCYSRREGVNFITEINAQSGMYAIADSFTTQTFPAGTSFKAAIISLTAELAAKSKGTLTTGSIGNFPGNAKTSMSFSRPIFDELQTLTGYGVFIDQGKINCVNNSESLPTANPILINSSTGLLDTPTRELNNMIIPVIFSPEITPGTIITLDSRTLESKTSPTSTNVAASFNGDMKVNSVHHVGTISSAVCGDLRTELGCIWGIPAVAKP